MLQLPGYQIQRLLGEGGMAQVWLALQESTQRQVALKILSPRQNEDAAFRERFLREARIVAQLHHPHIVTLYDVGRHQELSYLSMAYIPGGDLRAAAPRLGLKARLQAIREIAEALQHAHEQGLVHRDIKPENILIDERNGRAVLTDFGIAHSVAAESRLTEAGLSLGTPSFMSPEQALGRATDARSDLYSLGAVLYFLLAGRPPYQAETPAALGLKHALDPLPQLPPALSALQPLIDRTLAKLPEQRFENAGRLAEAIGRLQASLPEALLTAPLGAPLESGQEATRPQPGLTPQDLSALATHVFATPTQTPVSISVSAAASAPPPARIKVNAGIARSGQSAPRRPAPAPKPPPEPLAIPAPPARPPSWQKRLAVAVFSALLGYLLASLELFQDSGGKAVYFTAAELVRFIGDTTALLMLWLAARQALSRWPERWRRWARLRELLLPLASLVALVLLSRAAAAMLQPLLGAQLYNWSFVLALLATGVWLGLAATGHRIRWQKTGPGPRWRFAITDIHR